MTTNRRLALLAAAPLALALALSGCAVTPGVGMPGMNHSGGASGAPNAEVNAADTMFTAMMIPHHQQAIEMSDVVLAKDGIDERVRALAEQIKAAQGPEIELMESWLEDWGMPMDADDMGGMDHGDGMMSDDDMRALEAADGPEAARLFLEQMIEHHEGAIDMAQDELDHGVDPDVRDLAQTIIDAQTAEIATMRELLADL